MSVGVGTRLGSLEITAVLGKGGMGEVYRARDTKLKRDVAIKILPVEFSRHPERVARFQREAEVLASLNHPNIAAIYDLEEAKNATFLVLELVDGETLADRIARGPIPIDEALQIAKSIADALEAAHERGVIHRDLKPANVKITSDGKVKVLDFGLAKALENAPATTGLSSSPTMLSGTLGGMILGTVAYMSPEQAGGKVADRRSDIWSFGAVLYEMLSGKQAFAGESVSDTLATVMKVDPDWSALPQDTPASIHKLVRRSLTKDHKQRLQAIGDARIVIEEQLANPQSDAEVPRRAEAPAWKLPWILAAVGIAAALIVSFLHFREARPQERVQRYSIALPENTTTIHSFAISPDGRYVAIAAAVNGKRQLWLRALDALQAQPMPGTEDATYPFWSPDSRYIGFFAQGRLKKIAASGGPAQSLCDAPNGRGGSWNREDVIVFSPSGTAEGGIQRVSAAGGVPPADVTRANGVGVFRFPVFLPDGRHFLYLVTFLSVEQDGVHLSSLDGKEDRRVLADQSSVVFAAGRLLFIRENTLMAQAFDAASGQTVGEVFPVAESVSFTSVGNYAPVTVSEMGVLLYETGGVGLGSNNQMLWYDRGGKLLEAIGSPGPVREPAIAPDEKSLVFGRSSGSSEGLSADLRSGLWLRDLARGVEQRFTTDPERNSAPVWSPQGDRIAFVSNRRGNFNLYQKAASRTGQDELLLANGNSKGPTQWSRDGRFIVYSELDPKTKWDIWVLPMDDGAEQKPVSFLHSEFSELHGQLSPDSHWMAYTSDESGQREVYVRSFPAAENPKRISIAGGVQPRWRGDGKELFFVAGDGKMMAVTVKATAGPKPTFESGIPQPLFEAHLFLQGVTQVFEEYDVTADGKRFLLNSVGGSSESARPLNVVLNWDAGLRK
jgi:serine/threonine protein kinase/Tol biopolymer transport system component